MNHHKFEYLETAERRRSSSLSGSPASPIAPLANSSHPGARFPIRVTPSALGWLLRTIVYTIEFHAPAAPRPRQSAPSLAATAGSGVGNSLRAVAATSTTAAAVSSAVSSFFGWGGRSQATPTSGSVSSPVTDYASGRANTLQQQQQLDVEEAVRQRQLAQPCVVPIIQQIQHLGGIYIVVCHEHNKTIEPALHLALSRISALLRERQEKNARKTAAAVIMRDQHYHQQQQQGRPGAQQDGDEEDGMAASLQRGSASGDESCTMIASVSTVSTTQPQQNQLRPQSLSVEVGPTDGAPPTIVNLDDGVPPGSPMGGGSSVGGGGGGSQTGSASSYPYPCSRNHFGAPLLPFGLLSGELGLELSVRLLCSQVYAWRGTQQRVLAELTFPLIRTADESSVLSYPGGGSSSGLDGASEQGKERAPLLLVNDPKQAQDVVKFISDSFYKAISLDTFADFTAGELVFDIQVREKRFFTPPRSLGESGYVLFRKR